MKPEYYVTGSVLLIALIYAISTAKPAKFQNIKNYSPIVNPHLIKNTDTKAYTRFLTLLQENPHEVKNGDILIVTVNDWPLTLSELIFIAIQEEIIFDRPPDYEKIFKTRLDETCRLALAEEKNVLPVQEELAKHLARQKLQAPGFDQESASTDKSAFGKMGISREDFWTNFQAYYEYRSLAGMALEKLCREEIASAEGNKSETDYLAEMMADFKHRAKIKYITKIPELRFKAALPQGSRN
ncbi:MAG: hypothetical protein FWF85_08105 [Clostridiales bacterium]|nr:hypothetical protein [Clostridiales bacterium]